MTTSLYYSSFKPQNRTMCVSDILLDKPSMIKKMRSLMLEVKGLQTKMFLSKVISYISNGQMIDSRSSTQRPNVDACSFLKQNKSTVSTAIYTKDQIDQNIQTADSQYFSQTKNNQQEELDTISQAQTISCSCGLFDMVLKFVQNLIDSRIIKNKNQQLLINEQFFTDLQKQIQECIQKSIIAKEEQHRIQILKTNDKIVQIQNQLSKFVEKCSNITLQNTQLKGLRKKDVLEKQQFIDKNQKLMKQINELKMQVQEFVQEKDTNRRKRSIIRTNQIEALKFELELKDHQISNLRTVVQTLQKKMKATTQSSFKKLSLKSIQQQKGQKGQLISFTRIKDENMEKDEELCMIRAQLNAVSEELQNMYELNSIKDLNIVKLQKQIIRLEETINSKGQQNMTQCQQCQIKSQNLQILNKRQQSLDQQYDLLKKQFVCFQVEHLKRVKMLQNLISQEKRIDFSLSEQSQNEDIRITFGSQI